MAELRPIRSFALPALLALACTGPASERSKAEASPPPSSPPTEQPTEQPTPTPTETSDEPEPAMTKLKLELDLKGTEIRGRLVNTGVAATLVLHDELLQPSRPILLDAEGEEIEAFDERSRAKFDNTVYESMFTQLAGGATLELGEASFERGKKGAWQLAWGPYRFRDLPAGRYQVQLAWSSTITRALADVDDSVIEMKGVWLGELRSGIRPLTLP
jgi:hypothetical protein